MKKLLLGLGLTIAIAFGGIYAGQSPSTAQGNPTCPTRPVGDSTNACASTAFVQQNSGSGGTVNPQTGAYVVLTTDCNNTITLGGSAFYTLTVGAASGFPSACVLTIANIDTGRAKKMAINGITFPNSGLLWPTQSTTIKNTNNVWTVVANPGRWRFSAAVQMFADGANGSDTNNDCLASGAAACQTITHTAALFCDNMDQNGKQLTIRPPFGAIQTENISLCAYLESSAAAGQVTPLILGDVAAQNTYVLSGTGTTVTSVNVNRPWTFQGITINSLGGCFVSDINSLLYISDVTYGNCQIANQAIYGGKIEWLGNITIAGNYTAFTSTNNTGIFLARTITATCSGNPAMGITAQAASNSVQNWNGVTFASCSGATGTRVSANYGSVVTGNGTGQAFFPGNVNGTVDATTFATVN